MQSGFMFGLNLGSTAILHEGFAFSTKIAYAVTLGIVTLVGFLTLKYFVYQDLQGNLARQFVAYLPSVALFRGAEFLGFALLNGWLGVQYLAAIVAVQGTSFTSKYFYFRFLVFRER
ncbi:MAG: hypothetical protein U1D30_01720 [Planctomycetota bacterium]